jgi:hypothetical protein
MVETVLDEIPNVTCSRGSRESGGLARRARMTRIRTRSHRGTVDPITRPSLATHVSRRRRASFVPEPASSFGASTAARACFELFGPK